VPDGDPGAYKQVLGTQKDAIAAWVKGGGVLIGLRGGAALLADEEFGLTEVRLVPADTEKKEGGEKKGESGSAEPKPEAKPTEPASTQATPTPPPPGMLDRPRWPIETPGALLLAEVDTEHYLGYGLPARLPVFWSAARAIAADPQRRDPVRLTAAADRLRISGHLWPEAAEKLLGTPYVVDVPMGRGRVVLFIEDPSFRTLFWQLQRMLLNAVLLGPSQ
jgi:hypothetical protein